MTLFSRPGRAVVGLVGALALVGPLAVVASAPALAADPPRDVALDGVAAASSEFPDPARFAAAHVNDGDPSTRWGSDYTHGDEEPGYPPSDHDPTNDWIAIELAQPSVVHSVVFDWEAAYARQYEIQVSDDGQTWQTVAGLAGHQGRQEVVLDLTDPVGFVRMQGREASAWGYSMFSFEIWDAATSSEEPDPTGWDHGIDIAPEGVATASSVYTGDPARFAAANANDRNSATRWGTDYARTNPAEPPPSDHDPSNDWIQIALAEPSPVWSVVLDWETARPALFELQTTTDGLTWTTVREVTSPATGRTEYRLGLEEPVSHVRMQGIQTATTFGYSLWSFEVWSGPQAPPEPGGTILPAPVSQTQIDADAFTLTAQTRITIGAEAVRAEAELLAERLRPATGHDLPIVLEEPAAGDISLVLDAEEGPTDTELAVAEGYTLTASAIGVRVAAATTTGLFNGAQTLMQLFPAEIAGEVVRPGPWQVEATQIVDYPRFSHRGVMLDPARNFIEVDGVLGIIDALAALKGNRLHMHLSDDQGWRIEIPSWPLLTEIGGSMSMPGGRSGFYTQEQFAQIVAYAAARHIEVIPEIDLPGHSTAAIASYPELSCGSSNTVCTTSAVVDGFINDVIGTVAPMVNTDLFHIGGDESISGQPYIDFITKLEGFVMDHDLRMVGWTPLPMAGLDPTSVHQYWRDQSLEMTPEWFAGGNDVILSPTSKAYLDYPYPAHNAYSTHDWDPSNVIDDYRNLSLQSFGLDDDDIIGIEGPAWGENNSGGAVDVEHKVFPRLASILDLAWSPQELTADSRSFLDRLAVQGSRWQFAGTNFWPDPNVAWTTSVVGTSHLIDDDDLTVSGSFATVASPTVRVENLTATIDWGDGTVSEGALTGTSAAGKVGNSVYEVTGEHPYDDAVARVGTVTVSGPGGQSWTTSFLVGPPADAERTFAERSQDYLAQVDAYVAEGRLDPSSADQLHAAVARVLRHQEAGRVTRMHQELDRLEAMIARQQRHVDDPEVWTYLWEEGQALIETGLDEG
ncbi:family 20 glycosylhydrolase [Occultella gossypii]|uniref:beta-N-acetylhexosaminidase n=1 Tax=Occultella gossypii TaxID=2800820 RepID=A0ABS7S9L3_9MICO|nr:family 20 glycosylhydrolase [Occultella gossypii]MBZ2196895.1 family 20 glycosylhydrolase [Occultella gossypii]